MIVLGLIIASVLGAFFVYCLIVLALVFRRVHTDERKVKGPGAV